MNIQSKALCLTRGSTSVIGAVSPLMRRSSFRPSIDPSIACCPVAFDLDAPADAERAVDLLREENITV
jgi:hypothetical protein